MEGGDVRSINSGMERDRKTWFAINLILDHASPCIVSRGKTTYEFVQLLFLGKYVRLEWQISRQMAAADYDRKSFFYTTEKSRKCQTKWEEVWETESWQAKKKILLLFSDSAPFPLGRRGRPCNLSLSSSTRRKVTKSYFPDGKKVEMKQTAEEMDFLFLSGSWNSELATEVNWFLDLPIK